MLRQSVYLITIIIIPIFLCAGNPEADSSGVSVADDSTNEAYMTNVKTSAMIHSTPIRGLHNLLTTFTGVSKKENSNILHIQGGFGNDCKVYVDGMPVNNPYNNAIEIYLPNEAIEEISIQSGGFNAEYGEAASGVVFIKIPDRSDRYFGSIETITDEFLSSGNKTLGSFSYGYNEYILTAGGPIIPGKNHSFFLCGTRRWLADQMPSWGWSENDYKPEGFEDSRIIGNNGADWSFIGNAKFRLSKNIDIKTSGIWMDQIYSNTNPIWLYNPAHAPEQKNQTRIFSVDFNHRLFSHTFYNLRFNYFHAYQELYDRYFKDDLLAYGDPTKNPLAPAGSYDYGQQYYARIEPDFFAPGCQYNDYFKNETDYYGIDFDLTHQQGKHHTIKVGFGYKYHTLREYRALEPVKFAVENIDRNSVEYYRYAEVCFYGYDINGNEVDDGDYFDVIRNYGGVPISGFDKQAPYNPIIMNFYLQDKIELEDLIINLGLRYDRIDPNAWQFKDQEVEYDENGNIVPGTGMFHGNHTFDREDIKDSKVHHFFSPRLGASFLLNDVTTCYAQFGEYMHALLLNNIYLSPFYLDSWINTGGYFTAIDNPNLKPPKTTSYQVGFKQLLGDYTSLRLTAFYKETEDLVQLLPIQTDIGNVAFYQNGGQAVVKGLDLVVNLYNYNNYSVNFNYELQFATGTGSADASNFDIAWQRAGGGNYPSVIMPLNFERRHIGSVNVDYRLGKDQGSVFMGEKIFQNTGINLLFSFNSGYPYTHMQTFNISPFSGRYDNDGISETPVSAVNAETTPWNYRFDLKINRTFNLPFYNTFINVYLTVLNIFNKENVLDVWQTTGLPDDTGYFSTPYGKEEWAEYSEQDRKNFKMREMDYNHYGMPRQIRVGIKFEF